MEADTFPIVHPDGTVFASSADSPGAPEDKDQPQLHTASLSAVRATRSAAPPLRQQQPPGDAKRQLDTAGTEEVPALATRRVSCLSGRRTVLCACVRV